MLEQCEPQRPEVIHLTKERVGENPLAYLDDVVRYAFVRLGSREEAEDVAMEVFQAAFRFRTELPKKLDPKLYLIGIARRKIADHARRRKRERGPATLSLDDPSLGDIGVEQSCQITELLEALEALPELQRDALILKYLHGFTVQEIATLVRKSPQAVNSLLQRGRDALAKGPLQQDHQSHPTRRMP